MKNKDNEIIEELEDYIESYESRIEKVERFFDELSTWGAHSAGGPICIREEINFLIDYLKNEEIEIETYEKQLSLLDKKFEAIKQKEGYTEKLFKELTDLVAGYERAIKYIKIMFSNSDEFTNDLDGRDICEILIKELKGKKDISELKKRIEETDSELKKHAKKLFQRFYGYYESGEWDYYPKSYWWRHLKEFVEEQEEKNELH
jgi:chaperonin cofactor prefoldin